MYLLNVLFFLFFQELGGYLLLGGSRNNIHRWFVGSTLFIKCFNLETHPEFWMDVITNYNICKNITPEGVPLICIETGFVLYQAS